MINSTIGKYKITKLIGEGGMASVYQAEHEMLGTKVAIKVLNPILSANTQIKERFRNEAKIMASLDHPNITKVIDFDEQPQQLSIVMEFLNGEDLDHKIKRNGPSSEKEIIDYFSQTLSAFQYAHENGIVHRDIKPSNIFILPNGHVKIFDFGIAKLFGQGNEMTQTGTQMGTPIYMSPEQVKADKSIDHRSDIYSLGVTMFFAVNGKPPYNLNTDSQFDIFNKIVYEPLPELLKTSSLSSIISKACNKDRSLRFQYCQEWIDALINIESTQKNTTDNITVQIARVIESPYKKSLFPDFSPKENLSKTFYQAPYQQEVTIKPKFPKNISKTNWLIYCLIVLSLTSGICLYQIWKAQDVYTTAGGGANPEGPKGGDEGGEKTKTEYFGDIQLLPCDDTSLDGSLMHTVGENQTYDGILNKHKEKYKEAYDFKECFNEEGGKLDGNKTTKIGQKLKWKKKRIVSEIVRKKPTEKKVTIAEPKWEEPKKEELKKEEPKKKEPKKVFKKFKKEELEKKEPKKEPKKEAEAKADAEVKPKGMPLEPIKTLLQLMLQKPKKKVENNGQ